MKKGCKWPGRCSVILVFVRKGIDPDGCVLMMINTTQRRKVTRKAGEEEVGRFQSVLINSLKR